MEHGACNLLYVDQRAKDRTLRRSAIITNTAQPATPAPDYFQPDGGKQAAEIHSTLESLSSTFATGKLATRSI